MELGNVVAVGAGVPVRVVLTSLGLVAVLVGIVTDGNGVEVADMVGVMTTLLLCSVKEEVVLYNYVRAFLNDLACMYSSCISYKSTISNYHCDH